MSRGPESFWRRRIVNPVIALLKQGMTPDKLAQTIGAAFVCSMFPILGTTSVINLIVGLRFRLNHPLMQTLNQLLSPVHVVMIVFYVWSGEWIWHASDDPFTLSNFLDALRESSWSEIFGQFGWAAAHAITAWAITAPIFFFALYWPFRRLFVAVAARRRGPAAA